MISPKTTMTEGRALWRIFRYVQWPWIGTLLFLFCLTGIYLATGLSIRMFFNTLENNNLSFVWVAILIIALAQLTQVGANLFGIWLDRGVRHKTSALVRVNMFRHTLSQPGAQALPVSSSAAVTHYRDDANQISDFFSSYGIMDVFNVTFFAVVNVAILASISLRVTVLVLAPLIVVVLIAHFANERVQRYRKHSRETSEKVTSFIGEMVGAVQSVKAAKAEDKVKRKFDILNESRREATIKDRLFSEQINAIFANIGNIGIGLILLAAAPLMREGSFTVGDLAFFAFNFSFITRSAQVYGTTITRYQQSKTSLQRMQSLMNDAPYDALVEHTPLYFNQALPKISSPTRMSTDTLEQLQVRNLSYTFDDGTIGIDNISLTIPRGTFVVVTGRVGSGKTTLLRTLLGLYDKQSGDVYWNNVPVAEPATHFVPPRAAYTPQVPTLFSETLKENILMGLPEDNINLDTVLYNSVMTDDIEQLEDGISTMVGPRGVKLSGGQKQRTATARMLVTNADLLVFDDVSSALDADTEQVLWQRLASQDTVTSIAVSHRPDAFRRADQIIVLKDGKIDAIGTLEELRYSSAEMQAILQEKKDG